MKKMLFLIAAIAILYFSFRDDDPKPAVSTYSASSSVDSSYTDSDTSSVGSGDWGSGHQAGYDWAQEKDIDDEDDCDTAGDHSNSPSFAEGCKSYVQENK